jgi:hypothetical protein
LAQDDAVYRCYADIPGTRNRCGTELLRPIPAKVHYLLVACLANADSGNGLLFREKLHVPMTFTLRYTEVHPASSAGLKRPFRAACFN